MRLMNAFGDSAEHSILSAMPERLSARDSIARDIRVAFPTDAPPLAGRPSLPRLHRIARYMRGFDLVLTYNWGAFDAVMARRVFAKAMKLPPLVHHEDGFNEDETATLKPMRNRYRRVGLKAAHALVVPSRRLERIAAETWGRSAVRISNGIAVELYARGPEAEIPGLDRREGEVVVGTVAGLRAVKNLPRLVRAFAAMPTRNSRLVIVGEGPESERIVAEARIHGVAERLVLPGFLSQPHCWIGRFDIFALSSDSEQFPISLVEAMAAGLPTVATAVGDVVGMVSDDNRPLIVAPDDEAGFAAALDSLAARPDLRKAIGRANATKARAEYDERAMIQRYARLYGEAIRDARAFDPA